MNTGHRLDATWAISSKKPGRPQGYETTCAGEDSTTAARLVVLANKMGTPEAARAGLPDALPWLTITGSGGDGEPMVAIASIEWSDELDGSRQPIAPARLVWLPWGEVADEGLDYLSLWHGVSRLRWPEVDAGPEGTTGHRVVVAVSPTDRRRVIDDIDRDFDFIARLAAHLVEGNRVAIPLDHGDVVTTADRLRLLDAVMSLLPFGARNCLTVATWARYDAAQCAVLTFSDGIQPDQVEVSWRRRELPLPTPSWSDCCETPRVRGWVHDGGWDRRS